MFGKIACAVVALALVAGAGLGEEKKEAKKGTFFARIVKYDDKNQTLTVLIKRSKEDEGTKADYKLARDTRFLAAGETGEKPTPITAKDEIKAKLRKGMMVTIVLDGDGKIAKTVVIGREPKKNDDNK